MCFKIPSLSTNSCVPPPLQSIPSVYSKIHTKKRMYRQFWTFSRTNYLGRHANFIPKSESACHCNGRIPHHLPTVTIQPYSATAAIFNTTLTKSIYFSTQQLQKVGNANCGEGYLSLPLTWNNYWSPI